jgi:hypothetical protein
MGQSFVCPNGDIIRPINYLFRWNEEDFDGEKYLPIMNTPYSLDYFLIKHCPVKLVRKRMRQVYDDEYINSIENICNNYIKEKNKKKCIIEGFVYQECI